MRKKGFHIIAHLSSISKCNFYRRIINYLKIGLDIATLAFKERVGQMILIAGDSDFVPAAKFARKEGVDFMLDPMMNNIETGSHEHIDGLMSIKNMYRYAI